MPTRRRFVFFFSINLAFALIVSPLMAQKASDKPIVLNSGHRAGVAQHGQITPGLPLQFTAGTSYSTGGTKPYGVAVGDLNHDGKQDLVVVNQDQNQVAVILGNGDGTFRTPALYSLTPGVPYEVALADFNGDGKLDVAVINGDIDGFTSAVVVLLGNGDGTLGAPAAYDSGTSGITIVSADVNGDGKQDVLVGGNGNLSLLLGNGDGSLQTPIPLSIPGGGALWSGAVGDFNGDGRLDIVGVTFYPTASIAVFLQNPDGTFTAPQGYDSGIPIGQGIGVADFNGDGIADVIISANRSGRALFLGNGDGTFQAPLLGPAGNSPAYLALADFNRDGIVDIAFANYSTTAGPGIYVSAGFGNDVSLNTTGGTQVVAVGDFNGDGSPDIVSADTSGNKVTVFLNLIGAMQFVPVTPCRVVDTRNPNGTFGGPEIQAGTARDFPIPQGGCNIPSTAAAYSLNVTASPPGRLGFLTVWPTGEIRPEVSLLNSLDGRIKANAAIVPAGADGAVSVYANNSTNVLLDINGYFALPGSSTLQFYPLTPCRVVDTRNSNGPLAGPFLNQDQERDFPILSSSCIPSGITPAAYSFNVTAVPNPSGERLGFLTVWAQGQSRPVVSTLNNVTGTIVANGAIVPAGTAGGIAVYPNNTTDLLIDINGYFAAPGTGGLSLYTVEPCRVLDTRGTDGNGPPFMGDKTVNVTGSPCAPPSGAQAYVFNATVVPPSRLGVLTLWPDGEDRPTASTLNATDGAITSNMAIVPSTNGSIDAYANDLTQLLLDISSYFAP